MSPHKRIKRLVKYYEQRKEEAALRLSTVQRRIQLVREDLDRFRSQHADAGRIMFERDTGTVDIDHVRRVEDYRGMLSADIDRKKLEIETLKQEEDVRMREATVAFRRFKTWEKVKDSRNSADNTKQRALEQHELDDVSITRKLLRRGDETEVTTVG